MTDRLWRIEDIAEYSGYGVKQAWKLVSQPGFPVRVELWNGAHPRWVAREVMEFCEARRAA